MSDHQIVKHAKKLYHAVERSWGTMTEEEREALFAVVSILYEDCRRSLIPEEIDVTKVSSDEEEAKRPTKKRRQGGGKGGKGSKKSAGSHTEPQINTVEAELIVERIKDLHEVVVWSWNGWTEEERAAVFAGISTLYQDCHDSLIPEENNVSKISSDDEEVQPPAEKRRQEGGRRKGEDINENLDYHDSDIEEPISSADEELDSDFLKASDIANAPPTFPHGLGRVSMPRIPIDLEKYRAFGPSKSTHRKRVYVCLRCPHLFGWDPATGQYKYFTGIYALRRHLDIVHTKWRDLDMLMPCPKGSETLFCPTGDYSSEEYEEIRLHMLKKCTNRAEYQDAFNSHASALSKRRNQRKLSCYGGGEEEGEEGEEEEGVIEKEESIGDEEEDIVQERVQGMKEMRTSEDRENSNGIEPSIARDILFRGQSLIRRTINSGRLDPIRRRDFEKFERLLGDMTTWF